MSRTANLRELGAFLRARRAELDPAAAGLPEGGPRRRVRGLRRKEVAMLAAISTDYYTRLEQGRIQASAPSWPNSPGPRDARQHDTTGRNETSHRPS